MEEGTSWISHCIDDFASAPMMSDSLSELNDETDEKVDAISLDLILPDDLLEQILAYLPIASVFRAGSVCKRWHDIVSSKRFLWHSSHVSAQRPWYFMFTNSDKPVGHAYDPILRKWYGIDLPCIETSNWFISTSCGLVCFMDNDSRSELYIGNPMTKCFRELDMPPGPKFSDYSALAVSVDGTSHQYNVSIVKSKQVPGNFFQWDVSIHVYDSKTKSWSTTLTEGFTGWRGGDESVICDGILYFLVYSTGGGGPLHRHGLISYDLRNHLNPGLLIQSYISVPCYLTCGRLMNMNGKLVMVGGIGKKYRSDIVKGIGIWLLNGREWEEVARMPQKYFQGFGEFDDVFASSGTSDLIYIQSYGAPTLLTFDINQKQWKWSLKCPVTKKFPLQLFTGFCFEPRLEVDP